jgi:hypothetical protein
MAFNTFLNTQKINNPLDKIFGNLEKDYKGKKFTLRKTIKK